jgi:hypothetical protein
MRQRLDFALVAICFATTYFSILHAQPVPTSEIPKLPDNTVTATPFQNLTSEVTNALAKTFSGINSFEYVTETNTPSDDYYDRFTWKQLGNKYYYEILSTDKTSHSDTDEITSFDGKRTSTFSPAVGQIWIKNGEPNLSGPSIYPSPLYPFSFLETNPKIVNIEDLAKDSNLWKTIISRVSYRGVDIFEGHKCVVMRFKNSYNIDIGELATYDVYFDAVTLLPLTWKAYDKTGNIIEELDIVENRNIIGQYGKAIFLCPSHYRITQYQWKNTVIKGPNGVVKFYKAVRDVFFNEVQINSLQPDDVQIDPGLAKSIFDEDSQVLITIPQ